ALRYHRHTFLPAYPENRRFSISRGEESSSGLGRPWLSRRQPAAFQRAAWIDDNLCFFMSVHPSPEHSEGILTVGINFKNIGIPTRAWKHHRIEPVPREARIRDLPK